MDMHLLRLSVTKVAANILANTSTVADALWYKVSVKLSINQSVSKSINQSIN